MKAVGYKVPGPIAENASLVDIDLPRPVAAGHDILVEVMAVSVNPVDYKVRGSSPPADGDWKVLGWDAAGIVREVGSDVTQFKAGDEVYYAGSITRSGTNAQFHLVDARIVGKKPTSLDWAEAAALPLTTLTAWEAMFDRLDVAKPVPGAAAAILIIGGAGGVGSIAIQIARQRTDLTVIATASRPDTQAWVKGLGAHHWPAFGRGWTDRWCVSVSCVEVQPRSKFERTQAGLSKEVGALTSILDHKPIGRS